MSRSSGRRRVVRDLDLPRRGAKYVALGSMRPRVPSGRFHAAQGSIGAVAMRPAEARIGLHLRIEKLATVNVTFGHIASSRQEYAYADQS